MEKYDYYNVCLNTIKDLIEDLEKISIDKSHDISHDYSSAFYYLFIKDNIYVRNEIVDILDDIYEISSIHRTIELIWRCGFNLKSDILSCDRGKASRKNVINSLKHLSEIIKKEIQRIEDNDKNDFTKDLIDACACLQRNKHYFNTNENARNDYLRDLMNFKGYLVKDQSRTGVSQNGKEAGETDLIICNTDLCKRIVIECMNLNDNLSSYASIVETHYAKLMKNYDTNGNPYNILISYVKTNDFMQFSLNYTKIIENYDFEFKAASVKGDREFKNENKEISILKSEHLRNSDNVCIYHILIHIIDLKE